MDTTESMQLTATVSRSIFITARTGFIGQCAVGAEYMAGVESRARMLRKACMVSGDDAIDQRQMRLPFGAGGKDNDDRCARRL